VQVAVHDARGVDSGQAFGQPGREPEQRAGGQRPVLADPVGQRRADHVRPGQPRHVAVQVRVDHAGDKRPAHLRGRGDLGPEPGPEPGIGGQFGPDDPHHHVDPVGRTPQVHRSQAVTTKLPEQPVRPDCVRLVRRKRHYRRDPHSKWQLCQVMRS
jgi:hypothetical protein